MNKKAQVNQIFIFVFTILIIVFCGFVVLKFVGALNNDVGDRITKDLLLKIEIDILSIQNEFNSEGLHTYKIPGKVQTISFLTPACSLNLSYKSSFESSYHIVLLDDTNQVLDFLEIPEFGITNGCLEISDKETISLAFKNNRNKITIEYIQ